MIRVLGCITQQHEIWLVGVAAIICAFGCFTTLSVLSRARAGNGDRLWLAIASFTGGATIWTTHFVAMLAYHPGFAIGYDIPTTILSILFAVSLTGIAFGVALHVNAPLGGALFGAAVGAMHYTGMAALSAPAHFHWHGDYVFASVVTGVVFGAASLYGFAKRPALSWRLGAAVLMTLAIAGHHFTAMSALTLELDPLISLTSTAVMAPTWLAIAVAGVMVTIAGFGLAGSVVDQHLAQRAATEAVRLRAHVEELEITKADLNLALQQAAAASDAKSRFLAAMGHELRTPLNAIIGFSDVMKQELFGPHSDERYRHYAADVHNSGAHLLRLINDILDFSKIDGGHFDLHEDTLDPHDVVRQAMQMLRGQADAAGIRLKHDIAGDGAQLRADERRVRQVLLNLLSNAIKFTPRDRDVRISIARDGGALAIVVADTGIGIAAQDIPRAFEPFGQIDSRLARKYEGAGLGLPLSRRLMELHGGTLTIASELGVGTIVTMGFPADRVMAAPRKELAA
jgi:signal transduction histidine kinase